MNAGLNEDSALSRLHCRCRRHCCCCRCRCHRRYRRRCRCRRRRHVRLQPRIKCIVRFDPKEVDSETLHLNFLGNDSRLITVKMKFRVFVTFICQAVLN